jgi:hypothetical protein
LKNNPAPLLYEPILNLGAEDGNKPEAIVA